MISRQVAIINLCFVAFSKSSFACSFYKSGARFIPAFLFYALGFMARRQNILKIIPLHFFNRTSTPCSGTGTVCFGTRTVRSGTRTVCTGAGMAYTRTHAICYGTGKSFRNTPDLSGNHNPASAGFVREFKSTVNTIS